MCWVGWSFTRIIIEKMEHWGLNVEMGDDRRSTIIGLVAGCEGVSGRGKLMRNRLLVPLRPVSPEGSGSGLGRAILYIYPLIDLYLFYFIRKCNFWAQGFLFKFPLASFPFAAFSGNFPDDLYVA